MDPSWLDRMDANVLTELGLLIEYPELLILCRQNSKMNKATCESDVFWYKKIIREYGHPNPMKMKITNKEYYELLKQYQYDNNITKYHMNSDPNVFRIYYEKQINKNLEPYLLDEMICKASVLGLKDIVADIRKKKSYYNKITCNNFEYYTPETLQMTLDDPLIEIPLTPGLLKKAILFANAPLAEYLLSKGVTANFTNSERQDMRSNALSLGRAGLNIYNRIYGDNQQPSMF